MQIMDFLLLNNIILGGKTLILSFFFSLVKFSDIFIFLEAFFLQQQVKTVSTEDISKYTQKNYVVL